MRTAGVLLMAVAAALLMTPGRADAGIEVTGVFGGLLGGGISNGPEYELSIPGSFENTPLYGARISWFGPIFGAEGSYVRSNSGISQDGVSEIPLTRDATVSFWEANALISPIPGPFSPFFTAGIGSHSFDFVLKAPNLPTFEESITKSGFNFGGGLRVSFSRIVVRGEVRDHVTKLGPEDFDLIDVAEELGLNENNTIHNIEVSFGVGISF